MKITVNTTADAFAYCLVYLSGIDGHFDSSEGDAAGKSLAKLMVHFKLDQDGDGDVDEDDLKKSMDAAIETYSSCDGIKEIVSVLTVCVAFLKKCFNADDLKVMVGEFRSIVEADGKVTDGESNTIDILEEMFLS